MAKEVEVWRRNLRPSDSDLVPPPKEREMTEQFILDLIESFDKSTLASIDINQGGDTISLKRMEGGVVVSNVAPVVAQPVVTVANPVVASTPVATETVSQPAENSAQAPAKEDANLVDIKSPIVGTFYRAPSPDAPSYVEVGTTVKKGQPLCILEAMKLMNTLEAEYDGVIEEILVQNGDLVEFDQPIFKIRKVA